MKRFLLTMAPTLVFALLLTINHLTNNKHRCDWVDCDHYGEVMNADTFISHWGYEDGTDGFYTELTHFMNPEMTYEECEDYVFSGVE